MPHSTSMWLGMCCRWPASGTRSRSRSAAGSASCGVADISMVCRYRCRIIGVFATGGRGQRVVEDPLGLHHPRPRRRLAGLDVPQRPRGDVDERVGGQRLHVDVVGVRLGESDHGVGVGGVPGLQRVGVVRIVGGEAGPQRLDQARVRRPMRDLRRPGRVPSAPAPATRPGRRGRTPPTPCCSSVRSSRRRPTARSPDRGRAPARARSSGSPLRG